MNWGGRVSYLIQIGKVRFFFHRQGLNSKRQNDWLPSCQLSQRGICGEVAKGIYKETQERTEDYLRHFFFRSSILKFDKFCVVSFFRLDILMFECPIFLFPLNLGHFNV